VLAVDAGNRDKYTEYSEDIGHDLQDKLDFLKGI
jgi:hypothetical protein